jgi:hypothetical protein
VKTYQDNRAETHASDLAVQSVAREDEIWLRAGCDCDGFDEAMLPPREVGEVEEYCSDGLWRA